jgi:hypothetical protein
MKQMNCNQKELTWILVKFTKSKVAPLAAAKALISSSVPGSWPPNWLQGKAKIRKPFASAYWKQKQKMLNHRTEIFQSDI